MSLSRIACLTDTPEIRAMLAELLVDTVAGGGSVGFMHPLSHAAADAFWSNALASASRGERLVFGAFEGEMLIGSVSLLLDCPPNQPHRAEVAKMMTRTTHRRRGVATALLDALEVAGVERGRSLLVLDTALEEGASGLYEKRGYTLAGIIPDYAFKPHGGLTGTMVYWKRLSLGAS